MLTKGMEFDTDPYNSNVNILIWPNGSGKSNFLSLVTLLCDMHLSNIISPLPSIKKHPWFEGYPTAVLAQWIIWGASEEHMITIRYDLDHYTYEILSEEEQLLNHHKSLYTNYTYHHIGINRVITPIQRHNKTIEYAHNHLWLIYNPNNQSYMTSTWAIRKWDDLGSGEKSLLWMINEIITHESIWWMILIDEPELHLHPQYQKHLWQILELLSQHHNSQIIIATHSPLFINDSNIENVFRFALRDGHTHIINPVDFRWQEQARVKQILTDGNMSKLFFADIIIMVEWDTDEYFLHHYIREYFKQYNIQSRRYNYEILNIAGKSSLHAWRSFCQQFQIQRSFIGDWDNVISSSPFGAQIEYIKQRIPRHQQGHKISKSVQYQMLIESISNKHPELAKQIGEWILRQEKKHIHILHHGDLEAYLWLNDKWLDVTIDRYSTQFDTRLQNPHFHQYHEDLNNILKQIFHNI